MFPISSLYKLFTYCILLQKTSDIDWSKYWNPQLYVDNVVGEPRETVWNTVMFDPGLQAFVFEKRRIAGTFVENLELYQFPFDTQVETDFTEILRPVYSDATQLISTSS